MVYIFGLAIVFIFVVAFWCSKLLVRLDSVAKYYAAYQPTSTPRPQSPPLTPVRAIIIAVQNYLARRRDPTLPMPVSTQPSLSDTAESVFGRFIASTMAGVGESPLSPPPAADRRRSSVYSGVVRAHPDCGSDPDLPKYCESAWHCYWDLGDACANAQLNRQRHPAPNSSSSRMTTSPRHLPRARGRRRRPSDRRRS